MEFKRRDVQYPGRSMLTKVNANNEPMVGEEPILVRMEKDEGEIYTDGTPISPENLNKGNWRDDRSISFAKRTDDGLPGAKTGETQIVTKSNGETWIVPPAGLGTPKEITDPNGSVIRINGVKGNVEFISDPQTQITAAKNVADSVRNAVTTAQNTADAKSVVNVNNVKSNVNFTSDPQTQITAVKNTADSVRTTADAARDVATAAQTAVNAKSAVTVNGTRTDISFTSDPQTQLNGKIGAADLLSKIYPIGSIYISAVNTSPASFLGGAWISFGEGRTLVGVGTSDRTFAADEIGGSSTHTLNISEMPAHTHNSNSSGSGGYWSNGSTGRGGEATSSTGGGGAHNNLQPYVTVYMWRRTA